MGAQVPVCRSGESKIVAFILGQEETELLRQVGMRWAIVEDRRGTVSRASAQQMIGDTAMGMDNQGCFFMHYRIYFSNEPKLCIPVFAQPQFLNTK